MSQKITVELEENEFVFKDAMGKPLARVVSDTERAVLLVCAGNGEIRAFLGANEDGPFLRDINDKVLWSYP